jgi:hypothetical protein
LKKSWIISYLIEKSYYRIAHCSLPFPLPDIITYTTNQRAYF